MDYDVGGKCFSSKSAIAKQAQEILKRSSPGVVLSGDDRKFVLGLISCHPKAKEKIGPGVKHIIARVDPVWKKGKQFLIIRVDGSSIDFSYKKCVYGEMSPLDLFRSACRTAVVDDILAFKNTHLSANSTCPYYGIPLTKESVHVDHVKPRTFNWLVDEFIKAYWLDPARCFIEGNTQKRFSNRRLSNQFRNFHKENAVLELVSDRANQTCCKVNFKGEKNEHKKHETP